MTSSPFKVQNFWAVATPGTTLCLLDGIYKGSGNLLAPPSGLSGESGNPIIIRALNEGAVLIDGQFASPPLNFNANGWFVIEGINFRNGGGANFTVGMWSGSSHNVLRRIVVWDGDATRNNSVAQVARTTHNSHILCEDCAFFGISRKLGLSGHVTCRRCWIRWEGSINEGGGALTVRYDNRHFTCENCLVTHHLISMPETYTTTQGRSMTGGQVHSTFGPNLFNDNAASADNACSNIRVLGSLVYNKATDIMVAGSTLNMVKSKGWMACYTIDHLIAVVHPDNPRFGNYRGMELNPVTSGPTHDLMARNITTITGKGGIYNNGRWTVTNHVHGTSLAAVKKLGADPWAGTKGGQLCYRWVNGVKTTTPLWPWPMNDRIKAATAMAGSYRGPCPTCVGGRAPRTATDVTAEIEALLGPIPAQCRH